MAVPIVELFLELHTDCLLSLTTVRAAPIAEWFKAYIYSTLTACFLSPL